MLAPGGRITVGELVEEELLLALPIVPLHAEASDCVVAQDVPAVKVEAPEQTTQKPFAQLDELLKRLRDRRYTDGLRLCASRGKLREAHGEI